MEEENKTETREKLTSSKLEIIFFAVTTVCFILELCNMIPDGIHIFGFCAIIYHHISNAARQIQNQKTRAINSFF